MIPVTECSDSGAAEACEEGEEARTASLEADKLLREALAGLTSSSFHRAVQLVPAHREIVAAANRFAPHVIKVMLPSVDAPTGKPLADADLKTVSWTIDHPDDDRVASPIDQRRQRLLRLLREAEDEGAVPSTAVSKSAVTSSGDGSAMPGR